MSQVKDGHDELLDALADLQHNMTDLVDGLVALYEIHGVSFDPGIEAVAGTQAGALKDIGTQNLSAFSCRMPATPTSH